MKRKRLFILINLLSLATLAYSQDPGAKYLTVAKYNEDTTGLSVPQFATIGNNAFLRFVRTNTAKANCNIPKMSFRLSSPDSKTIKVLEIGEYPSVYFSFSLFFLSQQIFKYFSFNY